MRGLTILWLASLLLLGATAMAGAADSSDKSGDPADAAVIALYPGVAPGSETWSWHERITPSAWGLRWGRSVRNVVQPTLAVFKPSNSARAHRTAVLVIPGGGFRWLAIDTEGYDVARALAAHGLTAIVLKYRLQRMTDDDAHFPQEAIAFMANARSRAAVAKQAAEPPGTALQLDFHGESNPAMADGFAAMQYLRRHASELGVDPDRIGVIGFSAGGYIANVIATQSDSATRPDFVAQIYAGAVAGTQWRNDTAPAFFAVAADDFLLPSVLEAYTNLTRLGRSAELHVFQAGQHGFGMTAQGFTSDLWFEEFTHWLDALGF